MDKENERNEVALVLEVDAEVIEKVRTGEITKIGLNITEDNYRQILQNTDGHLLLVVEEMPNTFHSCYLYNKGEFPYAIKDDLSFLVLSSGDNQCPTKIIGIDTEPGMRFNYKGAGQPIVEDPNGDSCVWVVSFEVVPIPVKPRHYLMRWNPSISSFKEEDYEECVAQMENNMFRLNWSIYDWEEARRGDYFHMMRVGDDKAGIVFSGQFISDPYPADDWGGSTRRRMYVDMVCFNPSDPAAGPHIPLEQLQAAIPSVDWATGHSGILLSEEIAEKLTGI